MKHFNFKLTALAMVAGLCPLHADAAGLAPAHDSYITKMRQQVKPVRPFRGAMPWGVQTDVQTGNSLRRTAVVNPSLEFGNLSAFDYLTAPDGSTWFYTTEYEKEYVQVSEWYTEEYVVGYCFTIYDSSFAEVGKVKDKITLAEGETKVAHAVLDPSVSAHFFNTDDNYEVMVYLAMNTSGTLGYKVNYYNKVYSIGGERDAEGNSVSLQTIPGRCVDVCNAAVKSADEDCYYTFVDDIEPNMDDYENIIDWVNDHKSHVAIYTKATGEAGPTLAFEKDVRLTCYPGDTTDGIYFIAKPVNGTPYFVFSQYEKPYFVDPTGFTEDESATPDNSLLIETYQYKGEMTLVSTTKIPVVNEEIAGKLTYTFYSIGSIAWKNDIDMTVNGTPEAPAFLVARDFVEAANLDDVASTYDIYGNDGRHIRTLAKDVEGISLLTAGDGEPQVLLVSQSANSQYTFNIVNLYRGTTELTLSQDNNGDPLTASCQRVVDEWGTSRYAFVMTYYVEDSNGNDCIRVAWFNQDATLDRIDSINVGKDVMAATVNMYADCLSPTLFDTDDAMEYAVLVKRTHGNTTRNEFIVADDNGEWYAHFTEDDGKGNPYTFTIVPANDKNRLQMVYIDDDYQFHIDIYDLPFVKNGEGTGIETVNGAATSNTVEYYDLNGRRVSQPQSGIYVKKAGNNVRKVVVD